MLFTIKDKNGTHQHLPSTYICEKCGDENTRLYVPQADLFVCSSGCGSTEFKEIKAMPNQIQYPQDKTIEITCVICDKYAHHPRKVLSGLGWDTRWQRCPEHNFDLDNTVETPDGGYCSPDTAALCYQTNEDQY